MSKSFFCAFFVVLPDYDETAKSSNMNKESQLHSEHAHNDDKKRLNKKGCFLATNAIGFQILLAVSGLKK